MKLSADFNLSEFTESTKAKQLGIYNIPSDEEQKNLALLVEHVLQPLRTALGRSIKVTSGYRSPALNKAVGGVKTSQHNQGKAADIVVQGMHPYDVIQAVLEAGLVFDQAIQEFGEWTHLSYNKEGNRGQVLTAKKIDGKAAYIDGLYK